ncbi:uncharacterized protein MELLADRAFT_69927 [Melampsora larici-populina 98AG31]|uniref:Uncharacterized protein n=1 Tax=Melampsora larici-populina (strain 98AG31 / pathotype 3-4-7) TaxID=747676 RepID=F4SCU2_MELLP|nr:uncharacterized protein MELLADRAFT_69927 [Melampsora larici-populina 98AG31]EGF97524.1 hypothetical protein MELLADRAFT_69927 [Melampsora larici-populina 98AG31]
MVSHLKKTKKRLEEAQITLNTLLTKHSYVTVDCDVDQNTDGWASHYLFSSSEDLRKLKLKRVKARTGREKQELLNLPKSLVRLETQIHNAAAELGSEEFRELTGLTDDRAKPLLALQVAKGKLYEAKIFFRATDFVAYVCSGDEPGTTSQGRLNYIKSHKSKMFKSKYNSYHRRKYLHAGLTSDTRRLWYNWNFDFIDVIRSTAVHLPSPLRLGHDQEIVSKWKDLMEVKFEHWDRTLARMGVPDVAVPDVERDLLAEMEAEAEEEELFAPEDFELGEDDYDLH